MPEDYLVSEEVDRLIESYFVVEERFRDGDKPNFMVSQLEHGGGHHPTHGLRIRHHGSNHSLLHDAGGRRIDDTP